jgi:hypothetical protein
MMTAERRLYCYNCGTHFQVTFRIGLADTTDRAACLDCDAPQRVPGKVVKVTPCFAGGMAEQCVVNWTISRSERLQALWRSIRPWTYRPLRTGSLVECLGVWPRRFRSLSAEHRVAFVSLFTRFRKLDLRFRPTLPVESALPPIW